MYEMENVRAHCDIPCKVYDPAISIIAVVTILRLIDLIEENEKDQINTSRTVTLSRLASEKEKHAKIVKDEITVIWGDYFKSPQLESFPETHNLVHSIMQSASKCKQEVNRGAAEKLLDQVNEFATVFWKTKGIETRLVTAPYPPAPKVVQPIL